MDLLHVHVLENIDDLEPEGARLAFEALKPVLDEQSEYRQNNVNMDNAILTAAAVGRWVMQPEVRELFAAMPAAAFDISHVDRLAQAALATWHCGLMRKNAAVRSVGGMLPQDLVVEATALKQRMLQVLDYHYGAQEDVAELLDDIRTGRGYADLRDDLMRLADLYQRYEDELSADTRHYRAEDRALAGRLALAVHQVLGDGHSTELNYWVEYQARAWTLMLNTYDEVSALGRWLYRHEHGSARFPSLFALGRRRRRDNGQENGQESPQDGSTGNADTGNNAGADSGNTDNGTAADSGAADSGAASGSAPANAVPAADAATAETAPTRKSSAA